MATKTLTLASIYELQGLKNEAIEIYRDILAEDPENIEARLALIRLSGVRRKFEGVNLQMKEFFIKMDSPLEFAEFERWLAF
ncbi:MAG: tetratricopeptide repeat protein [Helicobacteraceae bacterium]|jgi:transcription elongation factor GreA-like protein|nr:tetratricopeptide repeat protein [Helicobacteraceae bacterium]MDR2034007.1 tetratricopeptide repeat protein [Helicobacteraceae bacterium]